jgi:hypothetical protein
MTTNSQRRLNHHTYLLWVVVILIMVATFLVDVAGWFRDGGGLLP